MMIRKPKTKKCTKCGEVNPLAMFYKRKDTKDRFTGWCKMCRKKYDVIYSLKNIEKIKERNKNYYLNNLEKVKAIQKNYVKNNSEKCKEYHKQWYLKKTGKLKAYDD